MIVLVVCSGHDWVRFGCGVVPQSTEQVCREADAASVARLVRVVLLMSRSPGTRRRYICTDHVYVAVVMAWSGGCGSGSAANSCGALPLTGWLLICCCGFPLVAVRMHVV